MSSKNKTRIYDAKVVFFLHSLSFHPEEILAENFVLAFLDTPNVPTPALKERVRKVLFFR